MYAISAALTFLPTADRKRLEELDYIITNPRLPPEERGDAEKERIEIETRRKTLEQTTYEEASEFRMYLFDKYRRLAGAGAGSQALQFKNFIALIEQRLYLLQTLASHKALEQEKSKAEISRGLKQNDRRTKARAGSLSGDASPAHRNPWAIPIDDDD